MGRNQTRNPTDPMVRNQSQYGEFCDGFRADDMEHIGMHFGNAGMGHGTQHISAAEIAADVSFHDPYWRC